ncbi:S8/S53 family peptidase [Daejeonella oryzae]|uniref:S8/S53 family peptidase n=1 Tax=Daejeonella oryzae TaxID=1122943 RepID=UPI0004121ABD|nr:S8/S53 family peptidase [Daejeonella oryzae]
MKKVLLSVFLLLANFAYSKDDPFKNKLFKLPKGVTSKDYVPGMLIVKFKASAKAENQVFTNPMGALTLSNRSVAITSIQQVFKTINNPNTRSASTSAFAGITNGLDRIYEVKFSDSLNIEELANDILQNKNVEYAEPRYIYYHQYIPNDALFSVRQNYLNQIKTPQAWDIIKNSSNVVIGIVDSGSDLVHPDLAANIYLNQADPVNGLDDDRDGYLDNYRGWDLIGNNAGNIKEDNNPQVTSDSTDHGVHVSGIASAVSDNGVGVASAAFNAKLLIVKVGADNNPTAIYRGYEGIKYAADHGAQIINCSWGGPGGGAFGEDIVAYALSRNCLIVAAAGNDNTDEPDYPASYSGVLSVASVNANDVKSSFSNFGPQVDISAPGSGIYNTLNGNRYGSKSGTSMSAPMIASVAALVKARFPDLNMQQVGEQMRVTADNIDALNPGFTGELGKGRVNVLRAVTESSPSVRNQQIILADKANGSIPAGDTLRIFFNIKNFLAPANGLTLNLSSTSTDVEVIDNQVSTGNLMTLESRNNVGPFRVFVKNGTPDNRDIIFKILYSANNNTYSDFEQFQVTVSRDYQNVEVNQISTTMTSNGRVGYSSAEAQNGLGFIYKTESLLYEASLMIGNSATKVSNNTRNDSGSSDEHFAKRLRVTRNVNSTAAFVANSEFNDSRNPNPLNVYVKHRQLAYANAPDDKYTIAEYDIQNTGSTDLSGVYIGLFTDWDVDDNGRDVTKYDAINGMGYVFGKNGGTPFTAVKLLTNIDKASYYPLSYQVSGDPLETGGGFTIAEKYQTLSSGIKASSLGESSANGYDVMFVIGAGPFNIPANGSVKTAFAFIGGDDLKDIQNSAVAAQNKYNILSGLSPVDPSAASFELKQNYPNPGADETNIEFNIPEESAVTLSLYTILGKKVKTLLSENLNPGAYKIAVNLQELESGIYLYKMQYGNKSKTLKLMVAR